MTRASEPRPYVVAWRLWDRTVVVIGGGAIGGAKVETLLRTGADILVVDPTPCARIDDLAEAGTIRLRRRRFRPTDAWGADLVVAATGVERTNERIARWARRFGALVNAVDDPDRCDVTIPAVVERGPATIAITTNGSTPAGARFLREELSDALPPDLGLLLDSATSARDELRHTGRYRYDYAAWRQEFFEPGIRAVRAGRSADIEQVQERFLDGFTHRTTPRRPGRITLVGAGPGGADLITIRGARALETADVVLYDRLADLELLSLAPPAAVRIPVGKSKGSGVAQHEICDLLVEHARSGSHVVRLKGGDPFVFGRGQEETDAALAAGIPVDVVPGLSSCTAAPALAGIPLTDRRLASGFAVVSGHRTADREYDWSPFANDELTLVVLMGATTAKAVAVRLLSLGRRAQTPVAFVHHAGHADEQVEVAALADVALHGCPFEAPTVVVIGEVAGYGKLSSTHLDLREADDPAISGQRAAVVVRDRVAAR